MARWLVQRFGVVVFGATSHPEYLALARAFREELRDRLGGLIERYRAAPENDLLSLLLALENAEGGLTTTEILGACPLLLFAGHETTSSLLGSSLLALLQHPDRMARSRHGRIAVELAVEELLRFEPPAKAVVRTVLDDHERGGHHLGRGDSVFLTILAANRETPNRSTGPTTWCSIGHRIRTCRSASVITSVSAPGKSFSTKAEALRWLAEAEVDLPP